MATAQQIRYHYDVSTEFYRIFLDRNYITYSCAVWDGVFTLEEAQTNKLARLATFADIRPCDSVLDIGCGWGGMMRYALTAKRAMRACGLTLSEAQVEHILAEGGPGVDVRLSSWSEATFPARTFDAITSIGAFEHFASREDRRRNRHRRIYEEFFLCCARWLDKGRSVGLQTIVTVKPPDSRQSVRDTKYLLDRVFPGSVLPTVEDVQHASKVAFVIQDIRLIGRDYSKTLAEWRRRLNENEDLVTRKFGRETYTHFETYFTAAKRCFDDGYTDLLQVSLRSRTG